VSAALYWWRSARGGTWRSVIAIAVAGGLMGAVALGALAGARRTASAYDRYLASINASDALVNIPGRVPGIPVTRPMTLISRLPGVAEGAAYMGLAGSPVIDGKVDNTFRTDDVSGTLDGSSFGADGFSQDRMTVLAGRLPATGSTSLVVMTPGYAARLGASLGSTVTFVFSNADDFSPGIPRVPPVTRRFRVAAIVAVPPVLTDETDAVNAAVLPPGATRQLINYYEYGWVGVRLRPGSGGLPALQQHLATLAAAVDRELPPALERQLGATSPSTSAARRSSMARFSRRSGRRPSRSPSSAG
jgi:hypothetical protein